MQYQWVIGQFQGDQAGYILGLANEGIGYFIRKVDGAGKGMVVTAAFKRPIGEPLSDNLEIANAMLVSKLDELDGRRKSV